MLTSLRLATVLSTLCLLCARAQSADASGKTAPATGTTVTLSADDIRLRGYSSLKDALRDLPGMEVAENFFSEIGTQTAVRGITGNNKTVVLVNGMRVNPPGGEYFPLRNDFSIRQAGQIEVSYGPNSTLHGSDAMNAVINVTTQAPPANGAPAMEAGGHVGLNSEREAWFSFGQVFDAARNIKFTGYVQYHHSDLTPLDEEYARWWQDYAAVAAPKGRGMKPDRMDSGLNVFARLQVGDVSLQSWYRESERSSSEGYGGAVLGYLPEARWADRSWVTEARHSAKIADTVTLDSSLTYNTYEVDPKSRYVFPATATTWFLNDFKYADGNSLALEEIARAELSPAVSLLVGGTYTDYNIIPKSTVPGGAHRGSHADVVRQGGSFVYYTQAGNAASRHEVPRVVESQFQRTGLYADVTWRIAPRLKAIVGGRADKDSRLSDRSYAPRLALVHDLTPALAASYTYAEAYTSPAPYFNATFDRGDILAVPNANLRPETSQTHELTFTYTQPQYRLGLGIYRGRQSNLILVSDGALPLNTLADPVFVDLAGTDRRKLVTSVNSGSSRNSGFDFHGRATVTDRLNAWFSYSYADFEASNAGTTTDLRGLSRHNLRLGATWTATPKLSLTPSLVARSTPENVVAGKLADELHNPWQLNLHVIYAATRTVEFYADLRNITDRHYALAGFTGEASPQETFNGVIGARFSF